jgi:replication factor A1
LDGNQWDNPILQILQVKNIQNHVDGVTRYKVTLYDGETQHTFGILATQKNHLVEEKSLKIGSVIKLEEFAANVLSKEPPKVVIILLNFEVIGEMEVNLNGGNQQQTTAVPANAEKKPVQNENIEPYKNEKTASTKTFFNNKEENKRPANDGKIAKTESSAASATPGVFNNFKIFGIANLNPYQNKWSIKARVTNKSQIRTWSNAKGDGKVFSVEFLDATGEIKASGFGESIDKYYDLLQVDRVYYISRATLKTANRQYSKLDNDYEMTFTNDTVIEECHETDNLPKITFNIIPISEIANKQANDFVDIIGVVKSVGDLTTIVTKATNREIKKREIHLVDRSNCSVACTLWGSQAENYEEGKQPVVLLKGAKVGDYNGKNLSVGGNTIMQIDPDIPEAHACRGWYDQCGENETYNDLSNQLGSSGSGSGTGLTTTWKVLDQIKEEKLGMGEKADYLQSKGIVMFAKKDNSMYMACPEDGCNKKVIDQNDGTYRCEKCQKSHQKFKWRMILNVILFKQKVLWFGFNLIFCFVLD